MKTAPSARPSSSLNTDQAASGYAAVKYFGALLGSKLVLYVVLTRWPGYYITLLVSAMHHFNHPNNLIGPMVQFRYTSLEEHHTILKQERNRAGVHLNNIYFRGPAPTRPPRDRMSNMAAFIFSSSLCLCFDL